MSLAIDDAAWASPWRTRSTAEKSILALGLLVVAVSTTSIAVASSIALLVTLLALLWARVPAATWVRAMLGPVFFIALGAVTIAVTFSPPAAGDLARLGPLALTQSGADRALLVAARALGATSALILLATTTPMTALLASLRRLRVPAIVIDLAAVIYRLIFMLLESVTQMRAAQTGRLGYVNGAAARRSFGQLAAAVLLRAWNRARRLEEGLAGRGGVDSVPVVPARPISVPFAGAAAALVAALGVASIWAGLR